jgi:hypothetical protein
MTARRRRHPHGRAARLAGAGFLLLCLGLLAATFVTYAASLGNAPVSDDRPLVVDNPFLGSIDGLVRIWTTDLSTASSVAEPSSYYRPFAMLAFWVNVALGGRSPASLRFGNVLTHAANAILLALFARRATGLGWRLAGLVALLFAVAPLCSEPVLWISGRFDLLVVTFALLALLSARVKGGFGLALGLASVAAGLLCKESFTSVLPLLLLDDVFVRRAGTRRLLAKYLAVATITAAYFALRRVVGIQSLDALTATGGRALAESFLFLVGTFLRELVWPTTLDPFRPYVPPSHVESIGISLVLGALVVAPLLALRRDGGNVLARVAAFGIAWFAVTTLPSAVVGPTVTMVGDRYAYAPLLGLFLAGVAAVGALEARYARAWLITSTVGSTLALAWAICTGLHSRAWRNDASLAESSLASSPDNPFALYLLGSDAAQHGRLTEADDLLARSLARNPQSWRTWNAVCYLRLHQNRLVDAERACEETIQLRAANPRAWVNLASVYVREGRWNDAMASAHRALVLKPSYAEAHYLAGASAANLGLLALAASHVEAGLRAEPAHPGLLVLKSELERRQRERPAP